MTSAFPTVQQPTAGSDFYLEFYNYATNQIVQTYPWGVDVEIILASTTQDVRSSLPIDFKIEGTPLDGAPSPAGSQTTIKQPIKPGYDLFETDPESTSLQFYGPTAIPPDFFGQGSAPFVGIAYFGGVPLETFNGKKTGDADTIVRRPGEAFPSTPPATLFKGTASDPVRQCRGPTGCSVHVPPLQMPAGFVEILATGKNGEPLAGYTEGAKPSPIPIEIVALSLQSVDPITVRYNGARKPESWDVQAGLSHLMPSVGHMMIWKGGTFDSQLSVVPRLTFTRLSDRERRTLDLGELPAPLLENFILRQRGAPWRNGCILPALAVPGLNDGFCPGQTPDGKKVFTAETALFALHGVYPAQPALEHFKCYSLLPKAFTSRQVRLTDQFGSRNANVTKRAELCNPVQKNKEPFENRAAHLQCYETNGPDERTEVAVQNQFGSQRLLVHRPTRLCLPTQKRLVGGTFQPIRVPIDHYQCYVVEAKTELGQTGALRLTDQFGTKTVTLGKPYQLCAPVQKTLAGKTTPIQHRVKHLVCYKITDKPIHKVVDIKNQFERPRLDTKAPVGLCVPSNKLVLP